MIVKDPRPDAAPDFIDLTEDEQRQVLVETAQRIFGKEMPIANGIECAFCQTDHPMIVVDTDATFMPERMEFLLLCPDSPTEEFWVRVDPDVSL